MAMEARNWSLEPDLKWMGEEFGSKFQGVSFKGIILDHDFKKWCLEILNFNMPCVHIM